MSGEPESLEQNRMAYLLGIDISTTGSKAIIMDERGAIRAAASSPHTLQTPKPLWSEQDPGQWWAAAKASIRAALEQAGLVRGSVAAVGLTGQMHGLVLLDEAGQVLRPAILWNDQRTQAQCDEIHARIGKQNFIQITGNVALTGFTAPKILWVQENEPEVYARVAHVLLPKDFVRYKLTGNMAMDKADGAGTVLMDLKSRHWSPEILAALNIPVGWMPELGEGPEVTGTVTIEAAGQTGLPAGIPVVAGAGDQAAQAVGVGAVHEGIIALTLGTSGVVFATTNSPFIEPQGRLHSFCHAVPDRWHLMGVMLSAGGSLRWYRDTFTPTMDYDRLLEPAAEIAPGADGLLFLPYLTGERTPYPDPRARGAFVGLTIRHTMPHLTRAVLEGVAFGLRDSFELMKNAGLASIDQVRISGGGAKSLLWQQILADVFDIELATVNTTEGAAYGAALLAGVGAGRWPSVDAACEATIRITGEVEPNPEAARKYEESYRMYRELYPALSPSFHRMSE
jgi:xylulokinase